MIGLGLGAATLGVGLTIYLKDNFSAPASAIQNRIRALAATGTNTVKQNYALIRNVSTGISLAGGLALRAIKNATDEASEFDNIIINTGAIAGATSKQLDDFALTAFRAHVGVTTTIGILVPGSMAITATRVVSTWVWDKPKADLIVQNEKTLQQLLVPSSVIRAFMRNPAFPLSVQTEFVSNLERLSGIPGTGEAVTLASTAESEEQARFLTDAVGMLVRYNDTQTPITRLIVRRAIIGRDRNGAIVVQAPVDYVSWTALVSIFAHRTDLAGSRRTIWLTGQLSPMSRENFRTLGWTVNEKVNPIPDLDEGR